MTAPGASAATTPPGGTSHHRVDIQVLRGVAVVAVLLYHGALLPGGYLGVDLFFVLSGFLMAGLIGREIDAGAFRLPAFYMRRAVRLMPAALTTLAVTTALAPFLLTPTDYGSFKADLFGALTFTANIVLFLQTDYFAAAAETRPLLHMWSLSLEEQFYLLFPLVFILVPKRYVLAAILGLALASAGLAAALVEGLLPLPVSQKTMASAAFFLLPARAFELLIGAAAALLVAHRGRLALPRTAGLAVATAILSLLALPTGLPHPGPAALAICLLTALLCASDGRWLPDGGPVRALARLGDWSYSIYLVHWPLLAYANSAFLGETPLGVRLGLILLALPLGALQWRFVEEPFRRRGPAARPLTPAHLAGAAAGCALFGLAVIDPLEKSYPQRPPPNVGLAAVCDQRGSRFVDHAACRTRAAPRVALLGDSYAMQWAGALAAEEARFGGLAQITKSGCAPVIDAAPAAIRSAGPRECAVFMADAAAWIVSAAAIEVVVVSSSWSRIAAPDRPAPAVGAHGGPATGPPRTPQEARIAGAVAGMVDAFHSAGKAVLLLAPAPSSGLDVATCHARRAAGVPLLAGNACVISLSQAKRREGPVHAALLSVARAKGIPLVRPAEGLCKGDRCPTSHGNTILYADRSHLTVAGALHLARALDLAGRIAAHSPAALFPPDAP